MRQQAQPTTKSNKRNLKTVGRLPLAKVSDKKKESVKILFNWEHHVESTISPFSRCVRSWSSTRRDKTVVGKRKTDSTTSVVISKDEMTSSTSCQGVKIFAPFHVLKAHELKYHHRGKFPPIRLTCHNQSPSTPAKIEHEEEIQSENHLKYSSDDNIQLLFYSVTNVAEAN